MGKRGDGDAPAEAAPVPPPNSVKPSPARRADHGSFDRTMVTEDAVLKTLDKPRKIYAILQATDPGGSTEPLQLLLMKMRDQGKLAFDIKKGHWRKV